MSKDNDKRISEPVQVYLDASQRRRLAQLADELSLSKSDVLRRGLEALEQQISDPAEHPALRIIGIASGKIGGDARYDVAAKHDRYLAEAEQKSWKPAGKNRRGR